MFGRFFLYRIEGIRLRRLDVSIDKFVYRKRIIIDIF